MISSEAWLFLIALFTLPVAVAAIRSRKPGVTSARSRGSSALIINGEALASGVETHGSGRLDAVFRNIDDLGFSIETNRVRISETVEGRDLADFGLVQVAAYPRPTAALINALVDYLAHHKVPAVNMAGIGAPTKLFQYVRFAQAGLAVPKTVYLSTGALAESFLDLAQRLELPFILKALSASGGRYNFLVRTEREFRNHLYSQDHIRVCFLAQQFIANDSTYRVLVLGGEVQLVMRRSWAPGTHLSNTEQGAAAILVEPAAFAAAAKRMAIQAARLIGSEVAGVNLIQDWATQRWYVLDANSNPAMATGLFVEDKLAAYCSYLHKRLGIAEPAGTSLGWNAP